MTLQTSLLDLALAAAAGALVGVEREQAMAGHPEKDFGGIRTFPLIAVLGCTGALLASSLGPSPLVGLLAAVTLFLAISHVRSSVKDVGLTSEIAALVTFAAGAVAGSHRVFDDARRYLLVSAIAAVTMAILALKKPLHHLVAGISVVDVYATAKFVLLALVLLPILPNQTYGPLDVLNPFKMGAMIALVAGISFVGYVAARILGSGRGLLVTGLIGGLVSSTAVTLTFAGRSKEEPRLSGLSAVAIGAASSTMFARIVGIVAVVDRPLLASLAAPLIASAVSGLAAAAFLFRRDVGEKSDPVPLRNPFELKMAIKFGLAYGAVLFIAKAAQIYIGVAGVLGSAVVAGLTDVDPIILSLTELHRNGLPSTTAAVGIALAAATNTLVKIVLATTLGGRPLGLRVGAMLGAAILIGGIVALAVMR